MMWATFSLAILTSASGERTQDTALKNPITFESGIVCFIKSCLVGIIVKIFKNKVGEKDNVRKD